MMAGPTTRAHQEYAWRLLGSILAKLGFGSTAAAKPAAPTADSAPAAVAAPTTPTAPTAPAVTAIAVVDVVSQLEARAAKSSEKLNWKTSIADLLKLLDLDSSFDTRKGLTNELGRSADTMAGSAQMNMWLHQTVLQELADNGGNIPVELLH